MDTLFLSSDGSVTLGLILFVYLFDVLAIVWYFTEVGAEEQS
jgi:hypothetical protein